jgi:hypothetical protein
LQNKTENIKNKVDEIDKNVEGNSKDLKELLNNPPKSK